MIQQALHRTKGRLKVVKNAVNLGNNMELTETQYGYIALPKKCGGCGPIYFAVMEKDF